MRMFARRVRRMSVSLHRGPNAKEENDLYSAREQVQCREGAQSIEKDLNPLFRLYQNISIFVMRVKLKDYVLINTVDNMSEISLCTK